MPPKSEFESKFISSLYINSAQAKIYIDMDANNSVSYPESGECLYTHTRAQTRTRIKKNSMRQ